MMLLTSPAARLVGVVAAACLWSGPQFAAAGKYGAVTAAEEACSGLALGFNCSFSLASGSMYNATCVESQTHKGRITCKKAEDQHSGISMEMAMGVGVSVAVALAVAFCCMHSGSKEKKKKKGSRGLKMESNTAENSMPQAVTTAAPATTYAAAPMLQQAQPIYQTVQPAQPVYQTIQQAQPMTVIQQQPQVVTTQQYVTMAAEAPTMTTATAMPFQYTPSPATQYSAMPMAQTTQMPMVVQGQPQIVYR